MKDDVPIPGKDELEWFVRSVDLITRGEIGQEVLNKDHDGMTGYDWLDLLPYAVTSRKWKLVGVIASQLSGRFREVACDEPVRECDCVCDLELQ